jgi:thiol-disulfide isomerase/thioredoxin
MRLFLFSLLIFVFAAVVGGVIAIQQHPERFESMLEKRKSVLKQIPDFTLPNLDGEERHRYEWDDKVLVLNFWAPWCPPCREETPGFVELQEKYRDQDVSFVGIAIDDKDAVQTFVDTYGVDYPILLGDLHSIEYSKELGNRLGALPYTVVADRDGNILERFNGGVKKRDLENVLKSLVNNG